MTTSAVPYGRQSITDADIEAVTAVLRSDWLTTGPTVTAFEEALREYTGARRAVTVTSGTAALHVAYAAAGVGPGDEVVTTPFTFVATASGAAVLGATVIFADVQDDTGNLDPAAAEAAMTRRTKVVAAVDYAGHPVDADELRALTQRDGALLLEDAAHS
ncbi:MAG: DegT/DnrJ/EryC1/StrS aminotransferase family protein, partial [Actinomycetota bacterium]|nr:DegT/DnrJ/EryC1/StrS aminotransferase family protein [Actinomycetota bacterium]